MPSNFFQGHNWLTDYPNSKFHDHWKTVTLSSISPNLNNILVQHACNDRAWLTSEQLVWNFLFFLRMLPDMLWDEWPSNLLMGLKYTLCVIWSKKKTGISIVAVVLSYALWQISVVMSARKIVFLQNSFQFSMSALILSMYYDFRITWDWGSLFQSSTNPLVWNSPPLPFSPFQSLTPFDACYAVRQIFTFRSHQ